MWNADVDLLDMLNNFCFKVYAQISLFMGENGYECFWKLENFETLKMFVLFENTAERVQIDGIELYIFFEHPFIWVDVVDWLQTWQACKLIQVY